MKLLNKLFILTLILGMVSCDMTDLDLQDNPNAVSPDKADINNIYNNIVLDFNDFTTSHWHFTGGLSRMRSWTGGFTYNDAYGPSSLDGVWYEAYAVLMPDIDALIAQADEKGLGVHGGSARIMKAYVMTTLVDLFDKVPYSEALNGTDIISPTADNGDQVYAAADALLDEAISVLGGGGAAPDNDLFYGGDASKWIKLAHTLKLRNALTTSLVDGNAAGVINKMVADGVIEDGGDDFAFQYGNNRTNPDTRNPFYLSHYENGDGIYMSNYYMWLLNGEKLNADDEPVLDPRIRYYFYRQVSDSYTQDVNAYSCIFSDEPIYDQRPQHYKDFSDPRIPYCVLDNGYYGRDHMNGSGIPPDGPIRTVYGVYPAGGKFDDNSFGGVQNLGEDGARGAGINPIMLSSFAYMMRAEAALTLGTSDDAAAMLEAGIRASMDKVIASGSWDGNYTSGTVTDIDGNVFSIEEFYGAGQDNIDEYVALVMDNFNAADADGKLDIIAKEAYIALWGNGLEAYNLYRRTCKPSNVQPTIEPASGDFARSALLPSIHVDLNANAEQKSNTTPVYWDTNSSGCAY